MNVLAVIVARNEAEHIGATIDSLLNQIPPIMVHVLDDGSTDRTAMIAIGKGCSGSVGFESHPESWVGDPRLAGRWNWALYSSIDWHKPDYVLISGADQKYPPNYVETLLNQFKENPNLVITSGKIKGQPEYNQVPRGSGRMVEVKWWKEASGGNIEYYPELPGWETWLLFKALMMGREYSTVDIESEGRATSTSSIKCERNGGAMKAIGYWPLYAIGRCLRLMRRDFWAGWSMLSGYLFYVGEYHKSDLRQFVSDLQRNLFKTKWYRKLGMLIE